MNVGSAFGECRGETKLSWYAFDTMGGVNILDHRELIASGTSFTGNDGGIGEEEFPNLQEPSVTTLYQHTQYRLP